MLPIAQLVETARNYKASDIHLHTGMPPILRVHGSLHPLGNAPVCSGEEILACVRDMTDRPFTKGHDLDFCYAAPDKTRQRVNLYWESGNPAAAIRLLNDRIPKIDELGLPPALHTLSQYPRGLVLVTGPTGSGKSTTLAAMIDEINENRRCHIMTMEDPIEYKYRMKNALINQREVGEDVESFSTGLRSALREDPDVILVGEMRDFETIGAAITAAETGHLVFSTLHTTGAASTIDRIIDVFPEGQQAQIRTQLASVLKGVVSQLLLPKRDGTGRVAVTEVMQATDAICNLIRESKTHQIITAMQTGGAAGMHTLNMALGKLVSSGTISMETAESVSNDKDELRRSIR